MPYRQTEHSRKKREERKRSIIESARELFSSTGYETATVKDIVDGAGTSIGNFYFYFQTKEELLLAVAKNINDFVFDEIDTLAKPEYSSELNSAIYIYVFTKHWYDNLEIARVLIQGKIEVDTRNRLLYMHKEKLAELTNSGEKVADKFPLEIIISAWQSIWLGVLELKLHDTENNSNDYWAFIVIDLSLSAAGLSKEEIAETKEKMLELI
ncbi:MAG: hypothetical protein SCALA702_24320 [Melioribacteraceae bacterium]|nr:MAG: hypothetical protein SCALA702_24320 [Melioribacteraceae bacterium]